MVGGARLDEDAALLAGRRRLGHVVADDAGDGGVEHLLETHLRQGRAFHVSQGLDLLSQPLAFLLRDNIGLLLPQIGLGTHKNDGRLGAMVLQLGNPGFRDVAERGAGGNGEAEKEDVGLLVAEGPNPGVGLLTGSIPQREDDLLALHQHSRFVIVEHSRNVVRGELIPCVADQHASLSDSTVADDDALDGLLFGGRHFKRGTEVDRYEG